jgi:hypothetical protein
MIKPQEPEWTLVDGNMRAERKCQVTGQIFIISIPLELYRKWRNGSLIQNVMPTLSSDERELLTSGYTPAEWSKIFRVKE